MSRSTKLYDPKAVDRFVENLSLNYGYDITIVNGSLIDEYICISHDPTKYNFYFYEVALNAQASVYKMQRFSKRMPKFLQDHLEEILTSDWSDPSYRRYIYEDIAEVL